MNNATTTSQRKDCWARALCLGFFILGVCVLGHKYYHFGYYDWDLALYSHVLWNLTHGSLYSSLWDSIFLGNHAEYVAFLLTPIYYAFPHSFTLITVKLAVYSWGAYMLYKIAEKITDGPTGLILTAVYLFYPANIFMLFYEFHFENLATGLIFAAFYFLITNRYFPYILTTLLLLTVKENVALIPAMFGIYALFSKQTFKAAWGLLPIILAIAVFYLNISVVIPHFREIQGLSGDHAYLVHYTELGSSYSGMFRSLLFTPFKMIGLIFSPEKIIYLNQLMLPLGLFPLSAPHILLLGAPIFCQHLLSGSANMHSITYHYAATLVPFIFLATVYGLSFTRKYLRQSFFRLLVVIMALGSLWIHINYSKSYASLFVWADGNDPSRRAIIKEIPQDSSVIATFAFINELIGRKQIYAFLDALRNLRPFTGKTFEKKDIEYALIDWEDAWIRVYFNNRPDPEIRRGILVRLWNFFEENNLSLRTARGDITLFERNAENPLKLITVSAAPKGDQAPEPPLYENEHFRIAAYDVNLDSSRNILMLTITYLSRLRCDDLYSMKITLKQNGRIVYTDYHLIGYAVYPTLMWREGEQVKENFAIPLQEVPKGRPFDLEMTFSHASLFLAQKEYDELFSGRDTPDLRILNVQFNERETEWTD